MKPQALLVIDVQNGLAEAWHFDDLVRKINQKIQQYRQQQLPIIFMQHTDETMPYGSKAWAFCDQLDVQAQDHVFLKYHTDSFYETGLSAYLKHQAITDIEVCGLQTEYCIDTALRVGHHLGFQMWLTAGMHSTFDTPELTAAQAIAYHERIWQGAFAKIR
ncbi:isochorismatase family protein [Agrilactobacillus fermenti]|uniref:isochorismatase family protein n=1 Tax=Agrilactobacillus fermenti TaxID=2586909 RepID=UPI001E609D8C|nr:isochorismatase family protein [Agrilactobacillus fermenti]MCD2256387.1 isochorismatase family protein [Agrilactobacillus fermenti]